MSWNSASGSVLEISLANRFRLPKRLPILPAFVCSTTGPPAIFRPGSISRSVRSSPKILTAEAMAPFRIAQRARPEGDPQPLPYLLDPDDQRAGALALDLEVFLQTPEMRASGAPPHRLSCCAAANMYWTVAQLVTHHTIGGCNLSPGDLFGSGTISAADASGYGSLLELSENGREPIALPGGETRTFLQDGDEVIMRATATADGFVPIGFGACSAWVVSSA